MIVPWLASAWAADPSGAVVTRVTGQVTAAWAGRIDPVAEGAEVPVGATLCTADGSFATVRLAATRAGGAHDEVTLFAGTCITVDRATADDTTRSSALSLSRGSLAVRDAAAGGEVAVATESGRTLGSEGGYRVTVEPGAARTEAVTGDVVVSGAGVEVPVPSGYGARVATGQAPSEPVALLMPANALWPADRAVLMRPDFGWEPVDRALGYRVEWSTEPAFESLVLVEDTDRSEWSPELLFLPFRVRGLWWRVAAFDRTGFVGVPSDPHEIAFPAGVGP
ncbi:MAG: hypothetical protein ABMA64_32480 [Myxococcota bacterium]